jgi:magnesium-transporting ATPase (P-type)
VVPRDDDLPRVPGADNDATTRRRRHSKETNDFFFTMLLMAVFLPALLIGFATLGSAIFTVNNVFMILILLSMFVIYSYYQEYYA